MIKQLVDADGAVQRLFPAALALRRLERHDQIGGRGEAHLVAVLGGEVAERDRQMRLADAGGAEKDDVLGALDEGEAGELVDLRARYAGGEAEVEAVERLDRREAGDAGEHLAGRALRASRSARSDLLRGNRRRRPLSPPRSGRSPE